MTREQKKFWFNVLHAFLANGTGAFAVSWIAPNDVGQHFIKLLEAAVCLGLIGLWQFFATIKNPYDTQWIDTTKIPPATREVIGEVMKDAGIDAGKALTPEVPK